MKKALFVIFILLCAGFAFAQTGVITELSGTVELKPVGSANFIPAKAGDKVAMDTIVSTGFKSSALITAGSTKLTVRPLTRLSLAEISSSAGTETVNVNMQTGRVRVDVSPPAGTKTIMTVKSPIATASVRGTSFEFDTQSLNVFSGKVAFQGSHGIAIAVSAGSSSEVASNGTAADPMQKSASELLPPPLAASETGYNRNLAGAPKGTFSIKFKLN